MKRVKAPVRKLQLGDADPNESPDENARDTMADVARTSWTIMEGHAPPLRLSRHVVRVVRGGR